jgi:hypothetical protein
MFSSGVLDDARAKPHQALQIAAQEWEFGHHLVLNRGSECPVFGIDERRLRGNTDGFCELTGFERYVDTELTRQIECVVFSREYLEFGSASLDGIGPGHEKFEEIFARRVGRRGRFVRRSAC